MKTTALHVKQIEKKQDNRDKILHNIWSEQGGNDISMDLEQVIHVVVSKMREATEVVCLSSNSVLPKEILQEIPRLAQKGVRIYLLLNQFNPMYTSFIANKAVVRINEQVVGSILLIDPKLVTKSGYLFSYNSFQLAQNGINFYLPFDSVQLKEAYHYFLEKFWSSKEEYRDGNVIGSSQKLRPPFDIYPLIDPESFYYNNRDVQYLRLKMEELIRQAHKTLHIGLSRFNDLDFLNNLLYLRAEQGISITIYTDLHIEHDFLKDFRDNENIVVKAIQNLNNFFLIADHQVGLLLSGNLDSNYEVGISLSTKAVQDFMNRLELLQPNMWLFHSGIRLGDIKSKTVFKDYFNNNLNETRIEEITTVDYGEIVAPTLREYFKGTHTPGMKQPTGLAKTIIHRWKLVPPLLNHNAKQDVLYEQWEKEIIKLKNYLKQVLEYAKTVDKEKNIILSSFLGRFFKKDDEVDVNKIILNLETAIVEIEKGRFDWSTSNELLKTVEQYITKLFEQQIDLKEKQDYYEKKEKWEHERNTILNEKNDKAAALVSIKIKYSEIEAKLNEVDPKLHDDIALVKMEIQSLEEKISLIELKEQEIITMKRFNDVILAICASLDEKIKEFPRLRKAEKKKYFPNKVEPFLRNEFERIGKIEVLNSILNSNNIQDGKVKMTSIKKEIATNIELREEIPSNKRDVLEQYEVLSREKEELLLKLEQLKQKGMENKKEEKVQLQGLEKEMKKAENDLTQIEKKLDKLGDKFNYKIGTKEAHKLPFSKKFTLNTPKEALPIVGKLYKAGKTRYLAIKDEHQLSIGEEEASRLEAVLVLE